ncbi:MAG TPA: aminotransferase class I/II-fold pyridoxal phosphate-dependent enzyme [Acidobacteriota bacterium]|jgi:hypothetical protein|nr:aminotransferase class I/II-fold pyridoxal phosphate-dependent enzyme [Acidobacteriota bacterium]
MPTQTVRLSPLPLTIPNSKIREIAALRPEIADPICLYFGETNLPTPEFIRQAATRAMEEGYVFYTPTEGYLELREAIATEIERLHGKGIDCRNQIIITDGGVLAAALALRILLEPGDEAILISPVWPYLHSNLLLCRAVPREIPLIEADTGFRLDLNAVKRAINEKTRALIVNSPNNPTGWVATPEEQKRLWNLCLEHNLTLLADEVYERLYYGPPGPTARIRGLSEGTPAPSFIDVADNWDHLIIVQSFSKTYSMTGWRLGYAVAGSRAIAAMTRLNEFTTTCASSISQRAGLVALQEGEGYVREMVARYKDNRDLCYSLAAALPFVRTWKPEGSFYMLLRFDGLKDSLVFAKEVFRRTGVGMAPGVGFGAGGEGSLRLCYAAEPGLLSEAFRRLQIFLQSYKPGSF